MYKYLLVMMQFTLILILICSSFSKIVTQEQRIFDMVFNQNLYNKYVRPVLDNNTTIRVNINPIFHSFIDVNEVTESIKYSLWFRTDWRDHHFIWDPEEFMGVHTIKVPISLIWNPDVIAFELIGVEQPLSDDKIFAKVNSSGFVETSVLRIVTIHCRLIILLFPFDTQNCTIVYSSWMYDGSEIDLYPREVITEHIKPNTEWTMLEYSASRTSKFYGPMSDVPFVEVHYTMVFKRKPQYYIFTLIIPSFVITTLALIGMFAPFNASGERQEKISMGLTTLLAMAVLLLMISDQMPKTSEGLPLLGLYIMTEMMMSAVASIFSMCIMYLHKNGAHGGRPVPDWLWSICCLRSSQHSRKLISKHSTTTTIGEHQNNTVTMPTSKNGNGSFYVIETELRGETDSSGEPLVLQHKASRGVTLLASRYSDPTAHTTENTVILNRRTCQYKADWQRIGYRIDLISMGVFVIGNVFISIIILMFFGLMGIGA